MPSANGMGDIHVVESSCKAFRCLFPVASSPYKRSFWMRPSFIRVTFPSHHMRLCFKRVYKLGIPAFPAPLYLLFCPAMWFPEYVWGSACETHSTFSLGVHALSKTHFRNAQCWLHRLYIHWLWYDLKACCWTILILWAWRVSWQPFPFAYWVHCPWVICEGRPHLHKLMNDL